MTFLPFDNMFFDNLICIAAYHHLDNDFDRQKTLSEMYRVLKDNGKVLISVFSIN